MKRWLLAIILLAGVLVEGASAWTNFPASPCYPNDCGGDTELLFFSASSDSSGPDVVLQVPASGNINNEAGTIMFAWTPEYGSDMASGTYVLFDASGLKAWYDATDKKIYFTDGTNTISTAALSFSAGQTIKLAFAWLW